MRGSLELGMAEKMDFFVLTLKFLGAVRDEWNEVTEVNPSAKSLSKIDEAAANEINFQANFQTCFVITFLPFYGFLHCTKIEVPDQE